MGIQKGNDGNTVSAGFTVPPERTPSRSFSELRGRKRRDAVQGLKWLHPKTTDFFQKFFFHFFSFLF